MEKSPAFEGIDLIHEQCWTPPSRAVVHEGTRAAGWPEHTPHALLTARLPSGGRSPFALWVSLPDSR